MFDDIVAGVAHDDDVLHGMANICQFTSNRGAQLSNDLWCGISLALECQAQFAHDIGALQRNLSGHCLGHLRLKSRSDIRGQSRL